jgi:hypothetical protein
VILTRLFVGRRFRKRFCSRVKSNSIYYRCGYQSYPSYLDHLHSSQCGQRQRRNNRALIPGAAAAALPPLALSGHDDVPSWQEVLAERRRKDKEESNNRKVSPSSAPPSSSAATSASVPASSSGSSSELGQDSPAISLEKATRQIYSQLGAEGPLFTKDGSIGGGSRSKRKRHGQVDPRSRQVCCKRTQNSVIFYVRNII